MPERRPPGKRREARDRGDVHDHAAALREHPRNDGPAPQKHRAHVDRKDRVERVDGRFVQDRRLGAAGDPGIVYQHVDPAEALDRQLHGPLHVGFVQAADLEQMAIVEAVFVYNAAARPDKLPRKDLPAPVPPAGGRGGN